MPRKKTKNEFYETIREGLKGTIEALEEGKPLTLRTVIVPPPATHMGPKEIVNLRKSTLRVSQQIFARMLNVAPQTVHAWEQGRNKPSGSSLRLMRIAEENPQVLRAMISPRRDTASKRDVRTATGVRVPACTSSVAARRSRRASKAVHRSTPRGTTRRPRKR